MNASAILIAEIVGAAGRFANLRYTGETTAGEDNDRWMVWDPIRSGC
jgi:hypothetical protein